ncbi:MAG: histidine phosphatase family protein [Aquabacterium sp.]|jgi:alpha-ribazole phosphatase|uniref:histidine phosphatase family protein n=1 Tax=Aquabacterium sp. TaxID=1872578 RepID=UPI002A35C622|nr:histidine phosphatase family protein [Aquabacterium sp.]MDX9844050.1 histidine phosphatase family protein [Aquabacterium sp.]
MSVIPQGPHVIAWRHPRPIGAEGRCIGRTDLAVDRRKAKRLAHRIRQAARQHGWPRIVYSSSLQRCAAVGRQLRRWGWRHHIDDSLLEMDFGAWDGLSWLHIAQAQVDAWCQDFAHHAPGGGESLHTMLQRVAASLRSLSAQATVPPDPPGLAHPLGRSSPSPLLIVAHAGWMVSARWVAKHPQAPALPSQWPASPRYGERCTLSAAPLQYRPVEPASRR